jgi:hypothetical protein
LNGHTLTIHVADGTYAPLSATGAITGAAGPAGVQIIGNTSTPGNCLINPAGNVAAFLGTGGALFYVDGFRVGTTGASTIVGCIWASGNGTTIRIGPHIRYAGAAGSANIKADLSGAVIMQGCVIENAAFGYHFYASAGQIYSFGVADTIALTGTPSFTVFASCVFGYTGTQALGFTGAGVGKRYEANQLAYINTYGGGVNYFPGNAAGTLADYGVYN